MKYAAMRFDGVSLQHNPEKLVVSGKNHIREYTFPGYAADSDNLGRELCRVSGEGEFCGYDCIEQYQKLERLLQDGKRAKLVLPHMQPMTAYLKELSLTATPIDNVLSYRFLFVEAQSGRKDAEGSEYYVTESQGESLWDIAYANAVGIDRLTALNPQIPDINELKAGERVRLC